MWEDEAGQELCQDCAAHPLPAQAAPQPGDPPSQRPHLHPRDGGEKDEQKKNLAPYPYWVFFKHNLDFFISL